MFFLKERVLISTMFHKKGDDILRMRNRHNFTSFPAEEDSESQNYFHV